jgi:hypothetical protein
MKKCVLCLLGLIVSAALGGSAAATETVLVAPAATFAVPTVVGSFVTPSVVTVVPQAVVVRQRVVRLQAPCGVRQYRLFR